MGATHYGPRPGSRAYLALSMLQQIGGSAAAADWLRALAWEMSAQIFQHEINRLLSRRQVFLRGHVFVITDAGRLHVGQPLDVAPAPAVIAATGRYVPPQRPLAAKHLVRLQTMREGAFDYLAIPSLMGSARVKHATALVVDVGAPRMEPVT